MGGPLLGEDFLFIIWQESKTEFMEEISPQSARLRPIDSEAPPLTRASIGVSSQIADAVRTYYQEHFPQ